MTNKEILATLEALCSNQHAIPEMRNCILCMCDDSGGLSVDDVRILKLAVSLEIEHQNVPPLLTKVLLRCCQLLPKRVKTMLRMKESAAASDVDSLVGILSSSIAKIDTFDENITANSSHTIHNCIVACLKYGMMEIHDATTCSVLGGCLKVIRLLIGMAYGSSSKSQIQWLLTPSQIHAMAVSHSSFHHCISQRKSISKGYVISAKYDPKFCSGLSRQIELIRLLLCTVSLDGSNVKVELDTWTVILSVYNASTDLADRMLRRLTFLYEQNGCCQDEVSLHRSFSVIAEQCCHVVIIAHSFFSRRYF